MANRPNVIPRSTSPAVSGEPSGPVAVVDTSASGADAGVAVAGAEAKPKAPRGPVLKWNDAREKALATVVASGNTSGQSIVTALQSDPSFADAAGQLTVSKVRSAITRLRKSGINIPKLTGRGGGGRGGTKRQVDVDGLNAILAAGVQPSA